MSKNTKNELRKLTANFFNTVGAGCVLLGIIGPLLTFKLVPSLGTIPYELSVWGLGLIFHCIARFQLWFLED
jgi:hypothetical protein